MFQTTELRCRRQQLCCSRLIDVADNVQAQRVRAATNQCVAHSDELDAIERCTCARNPRREERIDCRICDWRFEHLGDRPCRSSSTSQECGCSHKCGVDVRVKLRLIDDEEQCARRRRIGRKTRRLYRHKKSTGRYREPRKVTVLRRPKTRVCDRHKIKRQCSIESQVVFVE